MWQHELLDRYQTPGWLLELLDSGDLDRIVYAARYCSDRLNIRLLSIRADELAHERATTDAPPQDHRQPQGIGRTDGYGGELMEGGY